MTHSENDAGRTLYSVILAGLIEWAGELADLEDCRSAARHLTPAVRAYVTAPTRDALAEVARRIAGQASCASPAGECYRDHDGCYVAESLSIAREVQTRVTPPGECDNYLPPLTCLTAPSSESGRCDKCRASVTPPELGAIMTTATVRTTDPEAAQRIRDAIDEVEARNRARRGAVQLAEFMADEERVWRDAMNREWFE